MTEREEKKYVEGLLSSLPFPSLSFFLTYMVRDGMGCLRVAVKSALSRIKTGCPALTRRATMGKPNEQ